MLDLLKKYCAGNISTEEFRADFNSFTNSYEKNVFGLSGPGGGLYINTLAKQILAVPELDMRLRTVLKVSAPNIDAKDLMESICVFMENTINTSSNAITRNDLQPGRIPLFVSIWWHMQDRERWPIFYPDSRMAFEREMHYGPIPSSPTTDDYFTFRKIFLALQKGLGWPSWEMEHVCEWVAEH